ncbi:MAG TPA: sugar phosphate nucleotidyltransferase [Acidimicrobiales bacterium]|nr:sugar phosphate nucleotidyltransferase [Acidimicrobiales bacterium]
MKAVIMAGGEGTRLRPLTSTQPKPMLPLANRPMMEHIVALLREHGFDDIIVTVAFLPHAIRTYFGDGSEFGVKMSYATEESPLGTAGSVRNASDGLDEPFLVISGDVLTDVDLSAVVRFHEERGAMATIGLKAMENPLDFGIVITREDGAIERFLEKPTWGQVFSDTINTGIYVLEPEIFDYIPEGRQVDFSEEVFPSLLEQGKPLFGYVAEGYWEDVGTLEAYAQAHQDVLDAKVSVDIAGFRLGEGVWLGEGAEIDPKANVEGPAIIGDYCQVEADAHLAAYTVLGSNVRVGAHAYVERSIVHDNAYLGPAVSLRGTVVGRSSDLRRGARCEEGVVLGDESFVGADAVINSSVKVYPFKTVEAGAVVNRSIVWESRGARHLFGSLGVAGLANVDITPELAMRLAMAYATTLKKGVTVTTSRDSSRAARAIKRAVMVGLTATGVNVEDLEVATVPVTRFHVRSVTSEAGVTVRLASDDPQSLLLRFLDSDGIDITEVAQRKIERLYHREDFRRAMAADMGDIGFPARALEHYTDSLMATVDASAIRAVGFKVVLDYAFGAASFVMPNVLAKLDADVLAVNPYASTARATSFEVERHVNRVAEVVLASGAHVGAVIDADGEHLSLVDDTGHVLTHDEALFCLLYLVCESVEAPRVALPLAVSRSIEDLCKRYGAEIVWAKVSTPHLMEVASTAGVHFAGSQEGGYIFPSFLPAYDAVATFTNLLAMLAGTGVRLSKLVSQAPPVHIAHEGVVTPWEQKGMVMRTLVERTKDREVILIDGVKVLHANGWALVLPDPEEPLTHVWAEADSEAGARELAQEYVRRIRGMVSEPEPVR